MSTLITGASTGIGRATALRLAQRGERVFAGVRNPQDGAALVQAGGEKITALELDVTQPSAIESARGQIEASLGTTQLTGLVNNAGIVVAGPLEIISDEDLRRQFDVNFFGAMAVTRAFLPLLRASRGRIVNLSSIAGKVSVPFNGAYSASKFALEAASDALRLELFPMGIHVSLIEPGQIATPIWQRAGDAARTAFEKAPPEKFALYREAMEHFASLANAGANQRLSADRVAAVIERALFERNPRARYLIGRDARFMLPIARLPEPLRDRLFRRVFKLKGA
ncbi:MAG TPA: SDR family oxidoreductase [Candidatus Acidoferrales bacterium]|nr:SDR family oxidoreductase [Candidatus Acidoferrales bacterium]